MYIYIYGGHGTGGRYGEESSGIPRLNETVKPKVRQGRIGNMSVPYLVVTEVPTDCQPPTVLTSVKPLNSDRMDSASVPNTSTSSGSGGGRDFGGYAQAFHNATIASLRKACTDRRIPSTGVREVLVARLVDDMNRARTIAP